MRPWRDDPANHARVLGYNMETETVVDLLPYLTSTGGFVLDQLEGLAIAADGTMWVSTDNDGVVDHSGETMFFAIAPM